MPSRNRSREIGVMKKKRGTLPVQVLKELASHDVIRAPGGLEERLYQPSSLDLRLGHKAYRIRSSFLPQKHRVSEVLNELIMYEVDLDKNGILEKKNVYLIPLQEELHLPDDINGKANPKSTTGRLDIFTRVITDGGYRF